MIGVMAATAESRFVTAVYVSSDDGRTWQRTFEEDSALDSADPSCAYGIGTDAFFVTIGSPGKEGWTETFLLWSPDLGRTWHRVAGLPRSVDRSYVTVDRSGGPHTGDVYIHGKRDRRTLDLQRKSLENLWIARTADHGQTFFQLDSPTLAEMVTGSNGVVLGDGTFLTVLGEVSDDKDRSKNSVKAVRLNSGATSIDTPVRIADWSLSDNPHWTMRFAVACRGQSLYATWEDDRSGHIEVMFSSSDNSGATWSRPFSLTTNDAANGSGFNPSIAVNGTGVVGVLWYDKRGHNADLGWGVRFAASRDGGRTFEPSVRVSEKDVEPGPGLASEGRFSANGGDTSGLDVEADGAFRAAWIDNRTGVPQVWTSRITVQP